LNYYFFWWEWFPSLLLFPTAPLAAVPLYFW
jgi:hypothetical protein